MIAQQFSTMPALRKEQVKFLAPNYLLLHGQGMLYPLVTFLYTTNTLYTYIYIQVKKTIHIKNTYLNLTSQISFSVLVKQSEFNLPY